MFYLFPSQVLFHEDSFQSNGWKSAIIHYFSKIFKYLRENDHLYKIQCFYKELNITTDTHRTNIVINMLFKKGHGFEPGIINHFHKQ